MAFEKGDIVYFAEEHRFTHDTGIDFDGPLTVISSDATWTKVEGPNTRGYREVFTYRFEKRDRVEGEEIKFEHIKVGDHIRYEETNNEGMEATCGGVVSFYDAAQGHLYSRRGAVLTLRILPGPVTSRLVLVKAAPEVDEVLERVKAAGKDKLVEITREDGFRVAKRLGSLWTVFAPEGWEYRTNEEFAEYIRGAEVVWHD